MHRNIVGLNPESPDYADGSSQNPIDQEQPGFQRFTIKPRFGGDLTCAQGVYDMLNGRIKVRWWIVDSNPNEYHLEVQIPHNTEAIVYVPGKNEIDIREVNTSSDPAFISNQITRRADLDEEDRIAYRVESGIYEFISESDDLFPDELDCVGSGCPCCPGDCP
jgi:hypothetical protein